MIKKYLPNPVHMSWGFGTFGTLTMINSVTTLYLFFLVSVVGIAPALAGLLIFISKIFDVLTDPLMGWISDRTQTRWGRRRPYLFGSSFLCGTAMVLLFNLPEFESTFWQAAYVEFVLLFFALALTTFNVPYLAMPADMTDDYNERSTIMSYRALFMVFGTFTGGAIAGLIVGKMGGDEAAYGSVGWFLAAVTFATMMICVIGTRKAPFIESIEIVKAPFKEQVRFFLINRPFLVLGGIKIAQFLQLAVGGSSILFFFVQVLQKGEAALLPFGLFYMGASIVSIPFWLKLIERFGKREVFMIGVVLQAFAFMSWALASPVEPDWIFHLRASALGGTISGIVICGQSMILDVVEYDRRISGIRREGVASAAFSFLEKTMYAAGPALFGILLSYYGFDNSLARDVVQSETALFAITLGMAWIPGGCSLIMFVGLIFYDLNEQRIENTLDAGT
ncbi:MAG: MFS transporter [Erythrobacter sp.]